MLYTITGGALSILIHCVLESEKFANDRDPTLFTKLGNAFNSIVSELLRLTNLPGLPSDQLESFRQLHSQSLFKCRFSRCRNSSAGFPTEVARETHEQQHTRLLFCPESTCSRGKIGFKNQTELQSHKRVYHDEANLLIPRRLRGDAGSEMQKLDSSTLTAEYVVKDTEWEAIYNPRIPRTLTCKQLHRLQSRGGATVGAFSPDDALVALSVGRSIHTYSTRTGKYLATVFEGETASYIINSMLFDDNKGENLWVGTIGLGSLKAPVIKVSSISTKTIHWLIAFLY